MGIALAESGPMNAARMPVWVKAKGPCSLKQIQCDSEFTSRGRLSAGQTIDSSSAVRVTEMKGPFRAQSGVGDKTGNLQIAKTPRIKLNFSSIRFSGS